MKKTLSLVLLLIVVATASAQNYKLKQSDYSQIIISFSTPAAVIHNIDLLGEQFSTIDLDGFTTQNNEGEPALPSLIKTIEVPLGSGLTYKIINIERDTVDGNLLGISHPIAPAQPSRSKNDTSRATLVMNNGLYASNAICGDPTIVLNKIGIARNRNLASVTFNPISWNPVTNQVVIVRNITVSIRQKNADIEATKRMKRLYASGEYGMGIETINSLCGDAKGGYPLRDAKDYHGAPIRYTIVANALFRGSLDEFANWKRRKGFIVDLVYTDEENVGSTITSISNYLKSLYNNATEEMPAPTYVLLVGDVAQIPAFQSAHYSDLNYICWTEGDNIPDAYIGRFSAQNFDQLTPQISKTLMYEQYTFPDDSYLSKAALIAGVDGGTTGDYGYTHADPTTDYVARHYINASNGFNNIVYYKNNTNSHPDGVTVTGSSKASGTASALKNYYNTGCGWANYTAHGSETSWSDPMMSTSDVANMTNNNMPMVLIGNCCLTNSFQVNACLGEAFLRKGNNAGGVCYIGASDLTYWNEDVYWSIGVRNSINASMSTEYNSNNLGMYDKLFHTHGESYEQWHTTLGAMMFAGNMAVENSNSSASRKTYYWEVYHIMGDPSLMPYINGPAQEMAITAENTIPMGVRSYSLHCPSHAYVALTDEDLNVICATFADENGNATLSLPEQLEIGDYTLAFSAQGYKTHFMTVAIQPTSVFVKATALTPRGTLEAGKPAAFDLTLTNVGIENANNLNLEFRNPNDKMLIDTTGIRTLSFGLNAGQETSLNNTCNGTIWNDVADQSELEINVIVRWGNRSDQKSTTRFRFPVAAPKMSTVNTQLSTPNTQEATLTIVSTNSGHASLPNATATLLSLDPTLTCTAVTQNAPSTINPSDNLTREFAITTNGTMPENRSIPMLYTISNDEISFTDSLMIVFGTDNQLITFEGGTWGENNWQQGNYPWEITNTGAYEGNYCIRSKTWQGQSQGNGKTSEFQISWTSSIDDSITFYRRVSSEENYDEFKFYIDDMVKLTLSGEEDWAREAFFVPAGTHLFKFSYEKDTYVRDGSDCAWIDNLKLPLSGTAYLYFNDTVCQGMDYVLGDTTISTNNLANGIHQIVREHNSRVYNLTLTIVEVPQATINGGDVTIRVGETVRLTANGGNRYLWSNGEKHPTIDVYPTETTTYTVTAFNGRCSAEASTVITTSGAVGIDSQLSTLNTQLTVYPNPAKERITVNGYGIEVITISDIVGRQVKKVNAQETSTTIDTHDLPYGIYLLQAFTTDGNRTVKKIVIGD